MAPLDFSHVIAYLLPGFVGFYALIYISPRALELINSSLAKDASVGVHLFVLVCSLATGVIVSAARALLLDPLQFRTGVNKTKLDYSRTSDQGTREAFKVSIDNTYRFSQFYGNMFISVLVLSIAKLYHRTDVRSELVLMLSLLFTVILLFFAHRKQLGQAYRDLEKILSNEGDSNGSKKS